MSMEKKVHIKQVDNGYVVDTEYYGNSSQVYGNLVLLFDGLLHFLEGAYEMEVVIRKKEKKVGEH